DDSPQAGKVTVKTHDGLSLTLDDTPPGKITMETPKGVSITLDDGAGELTLKAPSSIVLETASLELKVGGLAVLPGSVAGSGLMNVTLPAAVNVQSTAITLTAATTIALSVPPPGSVLINGKPA